ncbi:19293_t:CDS:2, partial [Racocetra fulgida]
FYSYSESGGLVASSQDAGLIVRFTECHIFPTTPISELQDRPFPKTSACLVIGDEILEGKTVDSNSGFFAKFCFNLGISLKRIEVIPDKEEEIIEAVRRFSNNYDFVITSGGIEAKQRMALFPHPSRVIFPDEKLWIPIVIVNENIHILPGVPKLFKALLTGYSKYIKGDKFVRKFVKTYYPESFIAPILTEAQEKVKNFDVKIGSYPEMTDDDKYVVILSFLAKDNAVTAEIVEKISKEVSEKLDGVIVD